MAKDLIHRTTFIIWSGGRSFPKKVFTRYGVVGKVKIGRMIDDMPIHFFGYTLIKTSITCLHLEDRHLTAFGGNYS